MSNQKIKKVLGWMRDYGIILLTASLIILIIEYYYHDDRVIKQLIPKIENNCEESAQNRLIIDKNTLTLDSLRQEIRKIDSLITKIEMDQQNYFLFKK